MKEGILIVLIMLFSLVIHAQTKPTQPEAEAVKNETKAVKEEAKAEAPVKEVIKSVPAAKEQHAKPAHVEQSRRAPARPERVRPARSPRPAGRVVRPGRGR